MDVSGYGLTQFLRDQRLERAVGRFRRVGLSGVLDDTNHVGSRAEVPGEAAGSGMAWRRRDDRTRRWYPQGVTTSADAQGHDTGSGTVDGREVVLVSWYGHGPVGWALLGSRITVIEGVTTQTPRYRHVLLVEPHRRFGVTWSRPVRVHAGGIVWYGDHLYVAGGRSGVRVFRLDDLARVRNRVRSRGYRYVLPQLAAYAATRGPDGEPLMYSFMSLERGEEVDHLVMGEYRRKGGAPRLYRYALDRTTGFLKSDEGGGVRPADMYERQVDRMQGVTLVDGTWVVTASAGRGVPGDLWVGRPGGFTRHRGVLPPGIEDACYWPQRREIWSLTEWPGARWVFGIPADRWIPRSGLRHSD